LPENTTRYGETYPKSDLFNKACTNCKGSGKVKVPNIREMSFGEKREFVERRHEQRELDELSQMEKLERMMGC
jgi:hypothetical protein